MFEDGSLVGDLYTGDVNLFVSASVNRHQSGQVVLSLVMRDDHHEEYPLWMKGSGEVPKVLTLHDAFGKVQLVGSYFFRHASPRSTDFYVQHVVRPTYDQTSDYLSLRGVKSRVSSLGRWMDTFEPAYVTGRKVFDDARDGGKFPPITIVMNRPKTTEVGVIDGIRCYIAQEAGQSHGYSANGRKSIVGRTHVITESEPAKWHEHGNVHDGIRHLLTVVTRQEPSFVGHITVKGSRPDAWGWEDSASPIVLLDSDDSIVIHPCFPYSEVGGEGIMKWMNLRQKFSGGILPFIAFFQMSNMTLEARCIQMGVVLDHIGSEIALDAGRMDISGKEMRDGRVLSNNLTLASKINLIIAETPNGLGKNHGWSKHMAASYNNTKHHGNLFISQHRLAQDTGRAVGLVTAWIAGKIGVSDKTARSIQEDAWDGLHYREIDLV